MSPVLALSQGSSLSKDGPTTNPSMDVIMTESHNPDALEKEAGENEAGEEEGSKVGDSKARDHPALISRNHK